MHVEHSLRLHTGTHTLTHTAANHSSPKSPARLNVHLKIHTSVAPRMLWKNNEGQKSGFWSHAEVLCFLFLSVCCFCQMDCGEQSCFSKSIWQNDGENDSILQHKNSSLAFVMYFYHYVIYYTIWLYCRYVAGKGLRSSNECFWSLNWKGFCC